MLTSEYINKKKCSLSSYRSKKADNNRFGLLILSHKTSGNCPAAQSAQSCRKCFNIKLTRSLFNLFVINSNKAEVIFRQKRYFTRCV